MVTVFPPRSGSQLPPIVPNLLVQLKRGSYFALVPIDAEREHQGDFVPQWYSGNIYDVDAPPHLVSLPTVPSATSPTVYHLYVSGDYEVLEPNSTSLVSNRLLRRAD